VRQPHPSNGATTITVYDAFGRPAAEYSNQAPTGPSGLVYRMADHLGSTRLAMQGSSVLARYDYLPFGERIGSGINSRSSLYGSTGSMVITGQDQVVEQQFTAKERDAESGLDYFGARFFMAPAGGGPVARRTVCRPVRRESAELEPVLLHTQQPAQILQEAQDDERVLGRTEGLLDPRARMFRRADPGRTHGGLTILVNLTGDR